MDLSAPTRRTFAVLATAAAGTAVVVPLLHQLSDDDADPRSLRSPDDDVVARLSGGRTGVALRSQPGGVRAADVRLESLSGGAAARRGTGSRGVETGTVETDPFSMIGLTWRGGAATVQVRTRAGVGGAAGAWGEWTTLRTQVDGPDADGVEGDPLRRATELTWVGSSDAVQVRAVDETGEPARRPALALIEPETQPAPVLERKSTSKGKGKGNRKRKRRPTLRPAMLGRGDWGADDRLRSGRPTIDPTIRQLHVHHTVNSNTYARGDVAGLIRGMYRYHTQNLGWSDIGYNFLVDRFGRIWVGRAGGPGRPVRGAHTLGFNDSSTGVAVIGNFEVGAPNRKIIRAVSRVAAWKLRKHRRNPRGWTRVTSTGSDRYPYGQRVRVRVIDGHRDTNDTACPGSALYGRLTWVRRRAAGRIKRLT